MSRVQDLGWEPSEFFFEKLGAFLDALTPLTHRDVMLALGTGAGAPGLYIRVRGGCHVEG